MFLPSVKVMYCKASPTWEALLSAEDWYVTENVKSLSLHRDGGSRFCERVIRFICLPQLDCMSANEDKSALQSGVC